MIILKWNLKKEIGLENVDWIHLAENRDQQLAVVKVQTP
jgi:hypothetical protein